MNEKIDFVMVWVNGGDPDWIAEKNRCSPAITEMVDNRDVRYRDWDNIQYWFRAVEAFAPWFNKVYFVTCGHVPPWLNLDCPRLVHIKHSDYMPDKYLPTFSSHPIELNIKRIKGLSEHIVYFNDDTFITKPVMPDLFFRGGLPVHPACLHGIVPLHDEEVMTHIYANAVTYINRNFDMKQSLRKNWKKWYLPWKTGLRNVIENIFNYQYAQFPGFRNEHLPIPFLKSTMDEVWEKEYGILDATSMHKFRNMQDVNQYLFRYWQLASGRFVPEKARNLGRYFAIEPSNIDRVCDAIVCQKYKLLCINDIGGLETYREFEETKKKFIDAFEKILPEKSSFEI